MLGRHCGGEGCLNINYAGSVGEDSHGGRSVGSENTVAFAVE